MTVRVEAWNSLGRPHICIVGDLILDRYHWGTAERISPEAPVLVLRSGGEDDRLGGAASVATLLRGLECDVTLIGVVGSDPEGSRIRTLTAEAGINGSAIQTDPGRPTTWKSRILGRTDHRHPHQLLRIDRESQSPINELLTQSLVRAVTAVIDQVSAVLVSDYGKGVCTPTFLRAVFDLANERGIPVAVDPAKNVSFDRYRGASTLTPNRLEAIAVAGRSISNLTEAGVVGTEFCRHWDVTTIVLKLDREGLVVCQSGLPPQFVHASPRNVCDVTGAGDMILAVIGLCLASGWTIFEAAEVANVAAGLEVEQIGAARVSREEIATVLAVDGLARTPPVNAHMIALETAERSLTAPHLSIDEAVLHVRRHQSKGLKVVLANGCFDVFHAGHASLLKFAKQQGDVLIVAVNSDDSIKRLKGEDRPIWPLADRIAVLAAIRDVDVIICFETDTPEELLSRIKPDVLVKGADYAGQWIAGSEHCRRVVLAPFVAGLSTTSIINTIQAVRRITN